MTTLNAHNERLRKAGLPTVETLTRRILAVWGRANRSDVEAGARWYPEQHALAVTLSTYVDGDVERVACVIAALSPRITWERNVLFAAAILRDGPTAARRLGAMSRSVDKAWQAKRADLSPNPFGVFGSGAPKTERFARNIIGETEPVTVDVWALRVAGVEESLVTRVGVYEAIEAAYQRAARRVGVEPSTMQATTWIVARGGRAS